jgi:hypothetical protein
MMNPWLELHEDSEEYILEDDKESSERFRKGRCHEDLQLRLELLPQPFIGNPTAPVIFLCANPGYSKEHDAHDFSLQPLRDLLFKCIRREESDFPFYYLHPQVTGNGSTWWRKRARRMVEDLGCTEPESLMKLSQLICVHELLPYHSRKFGHSRIRSVSLDYQKECIKEAIDNGSIIVGMRSKKYWLNEIEMLGSLENISVFWSRNPRSAYVTPRNFGEGYGKIMDKLAPLLRD